MEICQLKVPTVLLIMINLFVWEKRIVANQISCLKSLTNVFCCHIKFYLVGITLVRYKSS